VKFVALQTVVLWLYTAFGMTSTYLPFFSPSSIFLVASNIKVLALFLRRWIEGGKWMQM
jgi:hypothetical protein